MELNFQNHNSSGCVFIHTESKQIIILNSVVKPGLTLRSRSVRWNPVSISGLHFLQSAFWYSNTVTFFEKFLQSYRGVEQKWRTIINTSLVCLKMKVQLHLFIQPALFGALVIFFWLGGYFCDIIHKMNRSIYKSSCSDQAQSKHEKLLTLHFTVKN